MSRLTNEEIIEILTPWNFWKENLDLGVERKFYLEKIINFIDTEEIIAITGIRRCGKSTILKQVLKHLIYKGVSKYNTCYINLEDSKLSQKLNIELLDDILETIKLSFKIEGKIYLILDEVQKIPGWEKWARTIYDKKEDVKLFVTGSSSDLLSGELSNLLTGRHIDIKISPLNFEEYLKFKDSENKRKTETIELFNKYNIEGGFPKPTLSNSANYKQEILNQYFMDILTKDIMIRYEVKDFEKLKNLAIFYMTNVSGFMTYNSVKNLLNEKSTETIEKYSNYLENSHLVKFIPMFDYSFKKQISNERKVYVVDNGLRNSVCFQISPDKGKLFENLVFMHLNSLHDEIFYFKEKKEVDFIIKKGLNIVMAINACVDLRDKKTKDREIASLIFALEKFKLKEGIIITINEEETIKIDKKTINVIPFYKYFLNQI